MNVAMLGMEGEFDNPGSISGIIKYISSVYAQLGKIPSLHMSKIEYKKVAKRMPWANHSAFYLQSKFTDFSRYDLLHNPNSLRIFDRPKAVKLITTNHDMLVLGKLKPAFDLKSALVTLNGNLSSFVGIEGFKHALSSDHIITDTLQGKEEMLKFIKEQDLDYSERKISIVRLGIDSKFTTQVLSKKKKGRVIKMGYLGSFNALKRVDFAIRAFKQVENPNARFELWGYRTIESELLNKEIGNDKRIQFAGQAPEEKKVGILDSFDIFAHTGIYESIMNYEALARGLPVIVWKGARMSPDLREHCIEVDDEAQMAQVISDIAANGYSEKKRKAAIAYARQFTWAKTAKETAQVYKKVV